MKARIILLIISLGLIQITLKAQTNVGGIISSNTTWSTSGSPYIVISNVLINNETTLTVEAGVTVKFNAGITLQNKGTLIAIGTETDRIILTSNQLTSQAGDWGYIDFTNETVDVTYDNGNYVSGSILEYVDILYSGGNDTKGAINITNSAIHINNVRVENSNSYGVFFDKSVGGTVPESKIVNSNILNNENWGVYCNCYQYNVSITVDSTNIENNLNGGISTGGGDAGGSHQFIYRHNTILNNEGIGINANSNGTQIIEGNTISKNTKGIRLRGLGTYTVQNNLISNNSSFGIHGIYATHIIDHNVIVNNGGAIKISQGGSYTITDNQILNNSNIESCNNDGAGFNPFCELEQSAWSPQVTIENNTFSSNVSSNATILTFQPQNGDPFFKINNNNFFQNISEYELWNNRNSSLSDVNAENNYWNTILESEIQSKIYDWNDNSSMGIVDYSPYLLSPNSTAPISQPINIIKGLSENGVALNWDLNPESDVAGYKVYYNPIDEFSYANSIDIGNTTSHIINGISITDTIVVTAYDDNADGTNDLFEGHESWYSQPAVINSTTTLLSGNTYCGNDSILYSIIVDSNYQTDNRFIIKISDLESDINNSNEIVNANEWSSTIVKGALPDSLSLGRKYLLYLKSTNPESILSIDTIVKYQTPSSNFYLDNDNLCGTDTVLITYNGTGTPYATYNWNFNDGNIISGTGQGDYQINWTSSGLKTISLSVEENGCVSESNLQELNVYQIPTSSFSIPITNCDTNQVTISYQGNASTLANYYWNFVEGNIILGSGQGDYEINWHTGGSKNVTLQVEENGCYSDTTFNVISVYLTPTPEFTIDTNKLCGFDTILVSYIGSGTTDATYNWDFSNGNIISGTGQGDYQINWTSSGLKNINLSVEENGCSSNLYSQNVKVYQPNSTFSLDNVVCEYQNTIVEFNGVTSDSALFNWDFDGASIVSESNESYIVNWDNFGDKDISLTINDNGCLSSQTIKTIAHNPEPTPTFIAPDKVCYNGIANIEYIGSASNTADYNWSFDNGSVISGISEGPYEIIWSNSGLKTVYLNVTENGCSSDTSINLTVNQQTQPISICMVSIDSSNHNMVVWEQTTDNPNDSIIIYKETSQSDVYAKIGSQSANNIAVFTDENSNPAQNSSRYKISALDTCAYETSQSDYHKTMHLTINSGINGAWNLIWSGYEGFSFSTYNIYRGTSNNNLLKIAEQASNTFMFTDLTPPAGVVYYQIEVDNQISCNISNLKSTNDYLGSTRSNIINSNQVNLIDKLSFEGVEIYPNPADDKLYLKSSNATFNYDVEILSLEGILLIKKQNVLDNTEIDISNLNSGLYMIRLSNNKNSMNMKLIKM